MSTHAAHAVRQNSLLAYWTGEPKLFKGRKKAILDVLRRTPGLTDCEIMIALDFVDPNKVRPRISDLIEAGVLEECGDKIDPETRLPVRITRIKEDPRGPRYRGQTELSALVAQLERTA